MQTIGKREFIQNTSLFLKTAEQSGLIITHHRKPCLLLTPITPKTIHSLRGSINVKVKGDINKPILKDYSKW